jgi:hypothetical protein
MFLTQYRTVLTSLPLIRHKITLRPGRVLKLVWRDALESFVMRLMRLDGSIFHSEGYDQYDVS